jgi:hypothetical protein
MLEPNQTRIYGGSSKPTQKQANDSHSGYHLLSTQLQHMGTRPNMQGETRSNDSCHHADWKGLYAQLHAILLASIGQWVERVRDFVEKPKRKRKERKGNGEKRNTNHRSKN